MNHELAKVLTTALVQFIDRERPEGTMCCSNSECAKIEKAFVDDRFRIVDGFIQKKLSRLTEFELCLLDSLPEEKLSKNLKEIAGEWAENEAYGKSDAEFEMAYKGFKAGAKWAMHQLKEREK